MRLFLVYHAPLSWGVMRVLAQGSIDNHNTGLCNLSAFATILNCRNQKINAYHTVIIVYLYSCGLLVNKPALEVLHHLNSCASYSHLNDILKNLANTIANQLKEDVLTMRLTIDNVNLFTGVRDNTSI